MRCADMTALLHGMLDGELDAVNAIQLERHLETCAACATEYRRQQELRAAVRRSDLFYRAPEHLRRSIEAAVPARLERAAAKAPWWQRLFGDWRLGAGTSLALAASLLLLIVNSTNDDRLQRDLVAGHIRSLQGRHLVDVPSSDQHTVKPWFNGKVDVSPPVVDLAGQGFPLVGGRLDYIDEHEAAVLVYRRNQHFINLFVWPAPGASDTSLQTWSHEGYNLLRWTRGEMSFWAVSELNSPELHEFQALYAKSTAP
jgi:mycothiol system anti-sigma-R factor